MSSSDLSAQLRLLVSAMRASSCDATQPSGPSVFVFGQLVAATLRAAAFRDPRSVPALPRSLQLLLVAALSPQVAQRPSDSSSLLEEVADYAERCAALQHEQATRPLLPLRRMSGFAVATLVSALCLLGLLLGPGRVPTAARHPPLGRHQQLAGPQAARPNDREPPTPRAPEPLVRRRAALPPPATRSRERPRGVAVAPSVAAPRAPEDGRFRVGHAPRRGEF